VARGTHFPLLLAALLVGAALSGCTAPVEGEGWVALGTGEWRFEPLTDGQPVPLIAGAQGGHHVWTSLRTTGLDPERVLLAIDTEPVDGSLPAEHSQVRVDLSENPEEGTYDFVGWPAILSQPGCVAGRELNVRVTLTDRHGVSATDECAVLPMTGTGVILPPCE